MKRFSVQVYPGLLSVVLVAIASLTFYLVASAAPVTLFSEDFESGSDRWTVQAGTWSVIADSSSVYSQTNAGVTARAIITETALPGVLGWADYSLQARVNPASGQYAMLMARYRDARNYYFMTLRSDNGRVELKRYLNGSSGSSLGTANGLITANTWYTAALEVKGTTIRALLNGTPVLTVTDSTFITGTFGLGSASGTAEFDDVLVTDLTSYNLSVSTAGTGAGVISSAPPGIACGATCSAPFDAGTVVTLTAAAIGDSLFDGWSGAGCTGTGSCVVTMTAATSVTATFTLMHYDLPFSEDFESGADRWRAASGSWSVISDGTQVYSQATTTVAARAFTGSASWSDLAMQARVKSTGGQYAMLMARYQDDRNYYFMALRSDNGKIEFKKMYNGSSGSALKGINAGIQTGVWYTPTFEVIGNTLFGYLNGTLVITATDPLVTPPFTAGRIGVGTLNAGAEFDDVLVTSRVPVYALTVGLSGNGAGSVASSPPGVDCGVTCTAGFERGTVVTLTATPADGSSFVRFEGAACTGSGNTCSLIMSAPTQVTAVFSSISQPMLIVAKSGTGSGTVTSDPPGIDCGAACTSGFTQGTVVTLTAAAGPFSTFDGWSGGICSGNGVCVVPMDTARWVQATFTYLTYSLTVTKSGNGTGTVTSTPPGISCGSTCSAVLGGVVTLTATADPGFSFAGWSGVGCNGQGQCVLAMDGPKSVTATFARYQVYLPAIVSTIVTSTVPPLYIAPTGSDANPGTQAYPLLSLSKAVALASPGQTIYMRGGAYHYTETVMLDKSGTGVNMYNIWAYGSELPVIDFTGSPAGARGFLITGDYWHIKGLEIMNAQDNAIKIEGSYNIVERCVFHHNQDTGLQIGLATESTNPLGIVAAYNQVINSDSYRNFDAATNGANADGFACKLHPGKGNTFSGCRAWENADDGWDMFLTDYPVVIEDSWTWHNGDRAQFGNPTSWGGNGNGFKVGGGDNHAAHILKRCIAFDHVYGPGVGTKGFDQNHNFSGVTIYNSLAWGNAINFSFYEAANDGTHHVLKNNIGFAAVTDNVRLSADTIQPNNSWTLPVTADAADFLSLAPALAVAPRQADGSLPANDFARLAAASDLIDKGVDVGLPYLGAAPDLGPFEKR